MSAPDTAALEASWYAEARRLGREAGTAAGSWAADGNTPPDVIRRALAALDEGGFAADFYLPPRPNLSGEWADNPTPASLFHDITGFDAHAEATFNPDAYGHVVERLCEAWEQGADETYEAECERTLRAFLPDPE